MVGLIKQIDTNIAGSQKLSFNSLLCLLLQQFVSWCQKFQFTGRPMLLLSSDRSDTPKQSCRPRPTVGFFIRLLRGVVYK